MFKDRKDAGEQLAKALKKYKNQEVLVLAIPRGGVEVGRQVAKYLNSDFSIIITRKLPFPDNPESGFGAITEDGSTYTINNVASYLPSELIEIIKNRQQQEIKRRIAVLRGNKPLPSISNKTVILIDDGIAMGSTMHASIMLCKKQGAQNIIVAVPVSGKKAAKDFGKIVDEIVILEQLVFFHAVAQVYENWYDVSDEEVIEIMNDCNL